MKTLQSIYQKYAPAIYHFALGLCGDPEWADDLTAETFVRALVSPHPIRLGTVKAYLFTITRNLYFQQLRKHKRLEPLAEDLISPQTSVEEEFQQREDMQRVLTALQALAPLDRALLLMRAQEDIPYADLAVTFDLSLAAVKVRIFRARRKLIAILKE